jgi:hypothetical protein
MNRIALGLAAAGVFLAAPAFATVCPSVHGPNAPLFCTLTMTGPEILAPGAAWQGRTQLPLNTTIKESELPVYSVQFKTDLDGDEAARVRVTVWLSDDAGGHEVPLGETVSTVMPGTQAVSLAVGGRRFAQPAHLNIRVKRADTASAPLAITGTHVGQSMDPDVEAIELFEIDHNVLTLPRGW